MGRWNEIGEASKIRLPICQYTQINRYLFMFSCFTLESIKFIIIVKVKFVRRDLVCAKSHELCYTKFCLFFHISYADVVLQCKKRLHQIKQFDLFHAHKAYADKASSEINHMSKQTKTSHKLNEFIIAVVNRNKSWFAYPIRKIVWNVHFSHSTPQFSIDPTNLASFLLKIEKKISSYRHLISLFFIYFCNLDSACILHVHRGLNYYKISDFCCCSIAL